jgi:sensor histidine kinase YesM
METINHIKKKKEIIISIVFILVSATIVGLLIQGVHIFSSFHFFIKYTSIGWALAFAGWLGNSSIDYFTSKKLDWKKNPKKVNTISLLIYIVFGLIYCTLIPYIYDLWWGVSSEEIFFDVLVKGLMIFSADLIVVLMFYSTRLANHWNKSIENNEELKRENLAAKFEALKNQVNPHFLFNSLNTLSGVVEQKPELATDFIKKLSDIYRYVLEQNDKELVPINDEMKFVDDYIFLLKMRFGDALMFNSDLSAINNTQIAPLGLQMLVENAIKHNIISDEMPLKIEISTVDGFVLLKNNIQTKTTIVSNKKPQGLENLKKRYAYLSESSMEIIKSDSEFIVKLPIIKS